MVGKNVQTEILLELVFSASGEIDEHLILNKCIPLYLRKLNCFQAGVLKNTENRLEELMLIPVVASKSRDWGIVKSYFANQKSLENEPFSQLFLEGSYYYAYSINTYGVLILGRKKPFDDTFTYELEPIVNHLGMVLIQAREIEQRKRAEKSLKESEQRLLTLSNTTTAGIFIYNDEKIFYANPAAERFSGYSITELMALNMLDLVHPDFKNLFHQRGFINKQSRRGHTHFEMKILRKNGEECWMDITIGVIEWMGEHAAIISAFDTTKRKQAQEDLINAKEKAEESDRLKSAFLNNISHEIRTPLNAITGFSALLTLPDNTLESQTMFIESILKGSDHLLSIVSNIIDISNIEAKAANNNLSKVNLNTRIENLCKQYMPAASEKNISLIIKTALPCEKAEMMTDRSKFDRVLSNLISNAIKFTLKGEVSVGYKEKDSFIEFFVSDTGIGIPAELHSKIFENFYQVEKSLDRQFEGTGLGLPIAKAFIEHLGGKIWLQSKPASGSTFYFTLPFVQPVSLTESVTKAPDSEITSSPRQITALVAEDDEISFNLIKSFLATLDIKVIHAVNGIEAVEICRSLKNIDLILMDIRMPGIDGYTASRQIREFRPDIIIIAQTAYSDDKEVALKNGCNDFISKPFSREQFISKVIENINIA